MNRSLDPGFMYVTIKWFVDMACFSRKASDRIACNIDAIFAQSQGEMLNLMKTKPVNFTFPFQANHKIDDDGLLSVTLIPAFVSFGSSLSKLWGRIRGTAALTLLSWKATSRGQQAYQGLG